MSIKIKYLTICVCLYSLSTVTPKPEKTEKPTKKPQKPTMKPSQKKPSKHPQEKPKAVPPKKKKELQLKTKNYKKQKPSVKENDISEQATPSVDKPIFPRQKQQRPTEPKNLVKLSWSVSILLV